MKPLKFFLSSVFAVAAASAMGHSYAQNTNAAGAANSGSMATAPGTSTGTFSNPGGALPNRALNSPTGVPNSTGALNSPTGTVNNPRATLNNPTGTLNNGAAISNNGAVNDLCAQLSNNAGLCAGR